MICVLSGGTGTPKLLQGIKDVIAQDELTVVVNTLENNYFSGVYVSADIDTVLYTMCDLINDEFWYGRCDDTFNTHEMLEKLGYHETLRIGDKDRALKIQKTELLKSMTLQDAVKIQKDALGIKANILPMSNEQPDVKIKTDMGMLDFHDFLIKQQSKPEVLDVIYKEVTPADGVIEAIEEADEVIIGPSNPITSINPILIMPKVKDALKKVHTTAISPFIGQQAVSGPAEKFMKAKGYDANCCGVAKIYEDFLDHFIIHTTDAQYKDEINKTINEVSVENIIFSSQDIKVDLVSKILNK